MHALISCSSTQTLSNGIGESSLHECQFHIHRLPTKMKKELHIKKEVYQSMQISNMNHIDPKQVLLTLNSALGSVFLHSGSLVLFLLFSAQDLMNYSI